MPTDTLCRTPSRKSWWIAAGAWIAGSGVALGAFGAHALRSTLEAGGHTGTWETAVLYQLVHGLALFALGVWIRLDDVATGAGRVRVVAWLWVAGVAMFCGSLYGLSLDGPRLLGPVTPAGGLCFLTGWVILGTTPWRRAPAGPDAP